MSAPLRRRSRLQRSFVNALAVASLLAALALPVATPANALAQEESAPGVANRSERIPDQYILVFAPDVTDPRRAANQIARGNGATVRHVYTSALRGFSARIPEQALAGVLRDPRIAFVEQDRTVHLVAETLPAGIDRIDADQNSTANIDGADDPMDVDVAIIDTGIDLNHPDLTVVSEGGVNCIDEGSSPDDDNGHGTHVAGTVAARDNGAGVVGVAPGAWLWPVKVLDESGSGSFSSVICGIDYVTDNADQIEVANMSLGAQALSTSMHWAIQRSVGVGVFYAVAAGNDRRDVYGNDGTFGTSDDFIPAAYPEVAAVSAMADFDGQAGGSGGRARFFGCGWVRDDTFADCFSNYSGSVVSGNPVSSPGAAIDLAAPGVSVLSTVPGGGTGSSTGTSMASPHVAGAAAIYIVANGLVPKNAGDVAAIRQGLIDAGQPQSDWQGGSTRDPDGNLERLVFLGGLGGSDPGPEPDTTDIAISSVSADASSVVVGTTVMVDVTVQNVGDLDVGSFEVTLTDATASSQIGTQTVDSLTAGNSTTVTFTWNTTGADIGDHQLLASHNVSDDNSGNDTDSTTVAVTEESTPSDLSVTGITPDSGSAGNTVDVTIGGTGFVNGALVTLENGSGPAPDLSNVSVVDASTITATLTIKAGGPPRSRTWDVVVTNPDGSSAVLAGGFTVTP